VKRILLLLAAAGIGCAATIQHNECSIENPDNTWVTVTQSNACSLTGNQVGSPPRASASTSISEHLGQNGLSATLISDVSFGASYDNVEPDFQNVQHARALADASVSLVFGTPGAVRQGTIVYAFALEASGNDVSYGFASSRIGPFSTSGYSQSFHTALNYQFEQLTPVPFALGTNFTVQLQAIAQGQSALYHDIFEFPRGHAVAHSTLSFEIYEADGATPVPLILGGIEQPTPVPEPSSIVLTACGLAVVIRRLAQGKRRVTM
jgi:hypothetical protein